jgi:RNA polymerase sigma-70 factor (ECF subfamily)
MIFGRDPLANPEKLIKRVYAYAAYRIGDGPEAEDVTSETFERALRYRKSYDRSKGEPLGWLIGIARRVIAGRGFQSAEIPMAELPEVAAPGEIEEEITDGMVVREAVASLDERDRDLVALRYGADLTVVQIAELLGLRTNTVDVALHRARKRLAAKLEPALDEGDATTNPTPAVRVEAPQPVLKVEGENPTRGDA